MDRQYVPSVLRVSVTLCRQVLSRRAPYRQTVINETPCHLLMVTSLRRCRLSPHGPCQAGRRLHTLHENQACGGRPGMAFSTYCAPPHARSG